MSVEQISIFAQLGLNQPGTVAGSPNVATDLALWESALASAAVGTTENAFAAAMLDQSGTMTDTVIDPATLSFVFQVVDVQTGNIISQEPVGAQLQLQQIAQLFAGGSTQVGFQATGSVNILA
jgi:hypothetical protein